MPKPSNEHGYCPSCGSDWDGGSIWETGLELAKQKRHPNPEVYADDYAEAYGATRTKGKWGREIGIYSMEKDRTVQYECPDCGHIKNVS